MRLLHLLLTALYIALPVLAALLAGVTARRQKSGRPLVAFGITCVSATLIAAALCYFYVTATASTISVAQVARTCYLLAGVMALLKGLSWLLKEGAERVWRVHPGQSVGRPRGAGWVARAAAGNLTRAVVLFAVGLPYIMAVGMVYRPKVVGGDTPRQLIGAAHEPFWFDSTDGVRLAGWWIPARPPLPGRAAAAEPDWGRKTVVLCHGLGANKANQLALARDLVLNGYNILSFDFRAHGESGGQLCSFGDRERFDVLGAVRWVRANRPAQSQRLFGLGVSMGGAALLAAAADPTAEGRAIDAVAVFSTYDRFATLAHDVTGKYMVPPLAWLVRHVGVPVAGAHVGADLAAFSPAAAADRLAPRPLMVVHGRGDHVIPFATGVRLFDRAPHPKVRMWVGELSADEGGYVLRTNAKYGPAVDANGRPTFNPPKGPAADHNNVLYDDDAVKAVRMFFEAGRATI